jgi:hypothetical protein
VNFAEWCATHSRTTRRVTQFINNNPELTFPADPKFASTQEATSMTSRLNAPADNHDVDFPEEHDDDIQDPKYLARKAPSNVDKRQAMWISDDDEGDEDTEGEALEDQERQASNFSEQVRHARHFETSTH